MGNKLKREIHVPEETSLSVDDYRLFLQKAYALIVDIPQYLATDEDIDTLELSHIIPSVPETVLVIYTAINDAVCNKALVTPFLVRHGHNNVFVFDPEKYAGGSSVPGGTVDVMEIINGFEPPNSSWNPDWTYVMIEDPSRSFESLWHEKGYIDMIAAKFEDFTMMSDHTQSKVCFFIEEKAFIHPINAAREYLENARKRGEDTAHEFDIPKGLEGEVDGLVPVVLHRGEKLYVATPDYGPCAHAWNNIHPLNKNYAVVNENSAVPLNLITVKPPVKPEYAKNLIPAGGSADMTTDWFYRGKKVVRKPLLEGKVKG